MVFYGLAVALIAVSVWKTHSDASSTTSEEATAIGVLYRNVSSYPEPSPLPVAEGPAGVCGVRDLSGVALASADWCQAVESSK